MGTKNLEKLLEIVGRLKTISFGSTHQGEEAHAAWKAAQKELEALKAALKPFADLSRAYRVETVEFQGPDERRVFGLNDTHITVGHMRAALKALED